MDPKNKAEASSTEMTIMEMSELDPDHVQKDDASDRLQAFDPLEGSPFPPIPGVTEWETRQLTLRSLFFGVLIGSVAAAANIYLGLMIGWGFGAGMISAMLGFAALKMMSRTLPERFGGGYFGPKENCSIQTAANASSSGTSVFVAA